MYPVKAQNRGLPGRVEMLCDIRPDQSLACTVASEDPPGFDFGPAAVKVFSLIRVAPLTRDGRPVTGRQVKVGFRFQVQNH